ncbi:hypothetical protein O181_106901 [Austropuccinia psidii MF-1]|uniref:Uncharacterized protein n=1 Tax=Austropuccinia psidii MF-1 TaxID=1389203 RepID=A0A9Q3PNN1_9BASI|nr:hypothetical protein [Austropuccinia psidii MF-1]
MFATWSTHSASMRLAANAYPQGPRTPAGLELNTRRPVASFKILNYRKFQSSPYFEAYAGAIPRGRFGGTPSVLCRPPTHYAHSDCKSCTIHN